MTVIRAAKLSPIAIVGLVLELRDEGKPVVIVDEPGHRRHPLKRVAVELWKQHGIRARVLGETGDELAQQRRRRMTERLERDLPVDSDDDRGELCIVQNLDGSWPSAVFPDGRDPRRPSAKERDEQHRRYLEKNARLAGRGGSRAVRAFLARRSDA